MVIAPSFVLYASISFHWGELIEASNTQHRLGNMCRMILGEIQSKNPQICEE
jgi:hypothetical protein